MSDEGYVELEYSADRTQVFATIHPPRGNGAPVTMRTVVERLNAMGVLYGVRESEIQRALTMCHETLSTVHRAVVAQGVLPEDGTDAQVIWKIAPESVAGPLPTLAEGVPDVFAPSPERLVRAGQLLATLVPARAGTPGKTLCQPLQAVRQRPGREASFAAGPGVRVSEDRLNYYAAGDGLVEFHKCILSVHLLRYVEADLNPGEHTFAGGAVLLGSARGATIYADGVVAVRGTLAGGVIRTHGDVIVTRAARARILTEGNVYVLGTLLHCEVNTRRKLIALPGATLVGGNLVASEGVSARDLGAADGTRTVVCTGVDQLSHFRFDEVEKEIQQCGVNIQKIGQALRPLTALSAEPLPAQKKELIQKLLEQRRGLEERVRELLNEKRALMMGAKTSIAAEVSVAGTAHPGVVITIHSSEMQLQTPSQSVSFAEEVPGRGITMRVLEAAQAA